MRLQRVQIAARSRPPVRMLTSARWDSMTGWKNLRPSGLPAKRLRRR